jgi:hypothetical protein
MLSRLTVPVKVTIIRDSSSRQERRIGGIPERVARAIRLHRPEGLHREKCRVSGHSTTEEVRMSRRKPRFAKNGTEPAAGAFFIDDDEYRTVNAATLWLDDAYSRSVYTLKIATSDLPQSEDSCQSVTLHLRWLDTSEAGTVEGDVGIPISGGSRGVRALIGLLEHVASRAEAKGHLVPVPPGKNLGAFASNGSSL